MGPRVPTNCRNLVSAEQQKGELAQKISKEIEAGRIAGPFDSRPLHNLRLSPIGLVKKKPTGWRMIHHLSFPLGHSVNSYIDPDLSTVQYTSFDKVLATIAGSGPGSELARIDIKSAFRLLIIHPEDFELFGFHFQGKFYYDKCLPMGCSASCALFEKFSTFLEWAIRVKTGRNEIEHYLDDFLFVGKPHSDQCLQLMNSFRELCVDLGVPIAEDKTLGPSCIMVFLGLEIDTIMMVIRIPEDKLSEVKHKLEFVLKKKSIMLKDLQSLVGSLNFCARAIPSVRAFNRRFCDAMCGLINPKHHIRVSCGMKEDIQVWLKFLENFNGTLSFDYTKWLTNQELDLFTDSAGNPNLGCAVYFSGHWSFLQWPSFWNTLDIMTDITFLELVPIVLSVCLFRHLLTNKRVVFHTDNKALVSILNKKSSKSKRVMGLIRPFVLHTMLNNMQFKAVHIEGRFNSISDSISRKQWQRFRELAPDADSEMTPVPGEFLQMISELKLTD